MVRRMRPADQPAARHAAQRDGQHRRKGKPYRRSRPEHRVEGDERKAAQQRNRRKHAKNHTRAPRQVLVAVTEKGVCKSARHARAHEHGSAEYRGSMPNALENRLEYMYW